MKKTLLLLTLFIGLTLQAQPPVLQAISGKSSFCSDPADPEVFTTAGSNNPTTFMWSASPFTGWNIVSGQNSSAATFKFTNQTATYTITCQAMNSSGFSNIVQKVVTVFESPTVTFSGGGALICQGSSTKLQATPTLNSGSSTLTFNWTPVAGLNNPNLLDVVASPQTTTTYTLSLTNNGLCTHEVTFLVSVEPCLGVSEYFSKQDLVIFPNPNNGNFTVKADKVETVSIYNELGQLVTKIYSFSDSNKIVSGLKPGWYTAVAGAKRIKFIVTE